MSEPRDTDQRRNVTLVTIAFMATLVVGACQASGPAPTPSPGPSHGGATTPTSPTPSGVPADPLQARIATITCDDHGPPHGGPSIGVQTAIERPIVPEHPGGIPVQVVNLTSMAVFIEPREIIPGIQFDHVSPGNGSVLLPFAVGSHFVRCNIVTADRIGWPGTADVGWVELRVVDRDRYLDPVGSGCLYGGSYGAWLSENGQAAAVAGRATATTPRAPCRV
jgi:hypothetical protein